MATTFLNLPSEIRQQILHEAIMTRLQTAIDTYSLCGILNYPPPYSTPGTLAASSIAAACQIIGVVAATPQISGDLDWVDRKCIEVLERYRREWGTGLNRPFRGLSEWVVTRNQNGEIVFRHFSR